MSESKTPTEIKECPFCGNAHVSLRFADEKKIMRMAYCRDVDCGARGPARTNDEWAITAWNHRASISAETGKMLAEALKRAIPALYTDRDLSDACVQGTYPALIERRAAMRQCEKSLAAYEQEKEEGV